MLGDRGKAIAAIPGVAHDTAKDIAFTLEHGEGLEEFALVKQEALILNARVDHLLDTLLHAEDWIAYGPDDALARAHASEGAPVRPVRICCFEDAAYAPGRDALAGLGAPTDQEGEQVCVVSVGLDLVKRLAPDRIAKADEELKQQRDRIALGLR